MTVGDVRTVLDWTEAMTDAMTRVTDADNGMTPAPKKRMQYIRHQGARERIRRLRKMPRGHLTTEGIAILLEAARREGPKERP